MASFQQPLMVEANSQEFCPQGEADPFQIAGGSHFDVSRGAHAFETAYGFGGKIVTV